MQRPVPVTRVTRVPRVTRRGDKLKLSHVGGGDKFLRDATFADKTFTLRDVTNFR